MKVIFITPPGENKRFVPERLFGCTYTTYPMPNIFLFTFASILRNDGNSVEVLDAPVIKMDVRTFFDYLNSKPHDIFIFYSVNLSGELDIKMAKESRRLYPHSPIIFCGPAPTYYPTRFIFDEKTFVARGEPDYILRDLVRFFRGDSGISLKEIKGITLSYNNTIIETPPPPLIVNLDELPFPAYDLILKDKYFNPKLRLRPFTTMITSRGCPYKCSFCVPCSLSFARKLEYLKRFNRNPPVTYHTAKRVIKEFEVIKRQGFKAVSIIDDEFLLIPNRIKEICAGIKYLGIKWGCLARADNLIDEELIQLMANAGCRYVDIGVESFNQEILNDLQKDLKLDTVYKAIALLKKYKIEPKLNILIGASPRETKETIKKTISEALKLNPGHIMFNICAPFPGTELYKRAKEENWFFYGDYRAVDVQKEAIIQFPHLKKGEIEKITRMANFKYFLKPSFIISHLMDVLKPKEFFDALKSLFKKL